MSAKKKILRSLPQAYCKKLNEALPDGTAYVVWPRGIQPRGFEEGCIGLGKTARAAWASVVFEVSR